VKAENVSAAGIRFEEVGEARLNASGLVAEGQGAARRGQGIRNALAVLLGLNLDTNKGRALLLGLDDSGRLAVHEEQVIGLAIAATEGELADSYAAPGVNVGVGAVLDNPAGLLKQAVDGLSG